MCNLMMCNPYREEGAGQHASLCAWLINQFTLSMILRGCLVLLHRLFVALCGIVLVYNDS